MSTAPPGLPPAPVIIYSHSNFFYLWPVWLIGFIFGLIVTPWSGQVLAIVPEGTLAEKGIDIPNRGKNLEVLIVPEGKSLLIDKDGKSLQPKLHISGSKNLGSWYFFLTALVIFFSTVTLRGLWSFMIVTVVIFLSIIFSLTGVWESILAGLVFLDVRINQGGYLFFSGLLFILWLLVVLLYDRQVYMVFTPGQVRVRQEIGEGEMAFDASGVTFQRLRNDWFRHWILGLRVFGFGTGDLIVRTGGAHAQTIEFPNVLFMDRRIKLIERMLQTRQIVNV